MIVRRAIRQRSSTAAARAAKVRGTGRSSRYDV